jgi:hypothetical protein
VGALTAAVAAAKLKVTGTTAVLPHGFVAVIPTETVPLVAVILLMVSVPDGLNVTPVGNVPDVTA